MLVFHPRSSVTAEGHVWPAFEWDDELIRYVHARGLAMRREMRARPDDEEQLCRLVGSLNALEEALGYTRFFWYLLRFARQMHDRGAEASALFSLGCAYQALAQVRRQLESWARPARMQRDSAGHPTQAADPAGRNALRAYLTQTRCAMECFQQAVAMHQELGKRRGQALDLQHLALAHAHLGDTDEAVRHLGRALELTPDTGSLGFAAHSLQCASQFNSEVSDVPRALSCQRVAVFILERLGDERLQEARERLALLEGNPPTTPSTGKT